MRGLIFDPFAGISGDMILGALVDISGRDDWLRETATGTGLGVGVTVERTVRRGLTCQRVRFEEPGEQPKRGLAAVLEVVERSSAPEPVRRLAVRVFRRLAEVEGAVHGVDPEAVHFHEIGAVDSILDVLCAAAGVTELGYEAFYTRPVTVGRGTVEMAHGRYPVPAPATARLLEGLPVRDPGYEGECTTPTGAALLAILTGGRRAPVDVTLGPSGYGAGARDTADRPNCLRLLACEVSTGAESLVMVQTDLDDMPAEYAAAAQDAAMAAGALDVVVMPVAMKKGRQGLRLEALASVDALDAVIGAVFASSSTIGVRYWPVSRLALPREEETVTWRGQQIRCKRVRLHDGSERVKPEYDDVVRAARVLGLGPYETRLALERELSPASKESE